MRANHLLAVAIAAATLATAPEPLVAQTKTGEAVAVQVTSPSGTARHAHALLGAAGLAEHSVESIRDWKLSTGLATAVTAGATDAAGATSIATVSGVDLLAGLITADNVIAVANADDAGTDAAGSGFEGLAIRGARLPAGDAVAPNTRIAIPGVGYAILNEQVEAGGVITVTMIRLVQEARALEPRREFIVARAVSGR